MSLVRILWGHSWPLLTTVQTDGHGNPSSWSMEAYNTIKTLDPYHPVSLCLNCDNYNFEEYSAGADILLSNLYPIGTDTTFSNIYRYVPMLNVPEYIPTFHAPEPNVIQPTGAAAATTAKAPMISRT